MLVIAVGEHSQKGKISALLDTPNEDTPLTKKLEHLANRILFLYYSSKRTVTIIRDW